MKLATLINSGILIASVALISGIANAQPATSNNYGNASATSDAKKEPIKAAINSNTLLSNSTTDRYLQPFNLVSLAYQGGLEQQGIPSAGTLIFERQNRKILAEDLVKAAVSANKLPPQFLNDQNYLSAVRSQLTSLSRDSSN
ncbi:hypothetical protein FD723_16540 [Nostoc sp. C052]|uniref:hypothetical protein n=1 Tax=Nostoc sp. C052 TaxID=2576902 RepID=UPI0015C3FFF4|nr:hypothetical protein [Nostoc sp. C052]QLE41868.1 hypothetical protein FD723_16540 [Nostoc sp. C052]